MKKNNIIKCLLYVPYTNWSLLLTLILRELLGKYRFSLIGMLWPLLTQISMVTIYCFVFGGIFKSKWPGTGNLNVYELGLIIYCGLSTFNFFNESVIKSLTIIKSNVNYVKKIVFPIEILIISTVITSMINLLLSIFLLILIDRLISDKLLGNILYLPIILIPFFMFVLGLSFITASLSVYIPDLQHVLPLLMNALIFLSPIFYPIMMVPEDFKILIYLNPLSIFIETLRNLVLFDTALSITEITALNIIGFLSLILGINLFYKLRNGFADVI